MRHWWQVGTRNWLAKPVRTLLATASIALGVALVAWVTNCYESVRRSVTDTVVEWIGRAQVSVESVAGRWALFDEKVAEGLTELTGVAKVTRRTLETVEIMRPPKRGEPEIMRLDLVGVDIPAELDFRNYKLSAGRMLKPGENTGVLIEELLARDWGLEVGDQVEMHYPMPDHPPMSFEIVGLIDRRRVSSHQLPMAWTSITAVQQASQSPGKIKAIDFIIADDSEEGINRAADAIRKIVRKRDKTLKVNTTALQLRQLRAAQGQLQFVLMLISCVALLTAFFIILSTMSMGVSERINQLGLMRCVGMTRGQVLSLVLIEVLPLSVAAIFIGLPLGTALQYATMKLVPEYVGQLVVSRTGILLAVAGGIGTALLGAIGPAIRAAMISPVAATRAAPQRPTFTVEVAAAAGGVALLIARHFLMGTITAQTTHFAALAMIGLVMLYAGYTLIAPLVVVVLGEPAVRVAAKVLQLRRQLVADQVGRRPWRSAAVCCGLMVGLSLIVALQVHSESIKAGWQFPKEFPEAMVYSWEDIPLERMIAASKVEGIARGAATVADDARCKLVGKGGGFLGIIDPFYRFIASDPETFPNVIKLAYLEGNEADALRKLKAGGHILATREFSQARKIHLGDEVTLKVGDAEAKFTVAGVVASPAIDIAVSFFNAGGEFQVYAVGSFIGTLADDKRFFGREIGRMLLFNFDRPADSRYEPGIAEQFGSLRRKPIRDAEGRIVEADVSGADESAAGTVNENATFQRIEAEMKVPSGNIATATVSQLKQSIDRNIDRVTMLLAAIPTVGLIVAALGVANLMMANVASRQRQIAVLRAVGATQFQMIRIVVAEALILGLIGSLLGLTMGLHLGRSSTSLTATLWGFEPKFAVPWPMVLLGAGMAVLLCLLAALGPARVASRSNIVAALQAT